MNRHPYRRLLNLMAATVVGAILLALLNGCRAITEDLPTGATPTPTAATVSAPAVGATVDGVTGSITGGPNHATCTVKNPTDAPVLVHLSSYDNYGPTLEDQSLIQSAVVWVPAQGQKTLRVDGAGPDRCTQYDCAPGVPFPAGIAPRYSSAFYDAMDVTPPGVACVPRAPEPGPSPRPTPRASPTPTPTPGPTPTPPICDQVCP